MRPGKLRHTVTIQVVNEARDSKGGITKTPATVTTRHAEIEPMMGDENLNAEQRDSRLTHKITMRHDSVTSTVTTKHQFSFDSRIFDIKSSVNKFELNKKITFLCEEIT